MNHHQLDDCDVETWSNVSKAILDAEIERGFKNLELEHSPLVEPLERALKTKLKFKTKVETIVLKKLNDLYEDSEFGPHFFLKNSKLLRSCLPKFRLSKSNPEVFGRFFHCSSPSPGIIIHFNSVTKRKEILFLLHSGDSCPPKPVKLDVVTILRWHRKRQAKVLKAQLDEVEARTILMGTFLKAVEEYTSAYDSFKLVHERFSNLADEFMNDLLLRTSRTKVKTRYISNQVSHLLDVKEMVVQLSKDQKESSTRQVDFDSLNPRLFEKKEYLRMSADHYTLQTKSYSLRRDYLVNYVNKLEKY